MAVSTDRFEIKGHQESSAVADLKTANENAKFKTSKATNFPVSLINGLPELNIDFNINAELTELGVDITKQCKTKPKLDDKSGFGTKDYGGKGYGGNGKVSHSKPEDLSTIECTPSILVNLPTIPGLDLPIDTNAILRSLEGVVDLTRGLSNLDAEKVRAGILRLIMKQLGPAGASIVAKTNLTKVLQEAQGMFSTDFYNKLAKVNNAKITLKGYALGVTLGVMITLGMVAVSSNLINIYGATTNPTNIAQVSVVDTFTVLDSTAYLVSINSVDYIFTSGIGATELEILDGIVALIMADVNAVVTAVVVGSTIVLTAKVAGDPFTVTSGVLATVTTPTVNVKSGLVENPQSELTKELIATGFKTILSMAEPNVEAIDTMLDMVNTLGTDISLHIPNSVKIFMDYMSADTTVTIDKTTKLNKIQSFFNMLGTDWRTDELGNTTVSKCKNNIKLNELAINDIKNRSNTFDIAGGVIGSIITDDKNVIAIGSTYKKLY